MADIKDKPEEAAIESLVTQMEAQGVGIVTVDDGSVFLFSTKTLEKLLEASRASGKASVFVRRPTAKDVN